MMWKVGETEKAGWGPVRGSRGEWAQFASSATLVRNVCDYFHEQAAGPDAR